MFTYVKKTFFFGQYSMMYGLCDLLSILNGRIKAKKKYCGRKGKLYIFSTTHKEVSIFESRADYKGS